MLGIPKAVFTTRAPPPLYARVAGTLAAVEHRDRAAAAGLGLVAGAVGARDDVVDRGAAGADLGHADAGADLVDLALILEAEPADGRADGAGDFLAGRRQRSS